eukprot:745787-Hanusia_phi.AAC.3
MVKLLQALRLEDLAIAHNNLGVVLARMGELKNAEESFEEARRLAPSYQVTPRSCSHGFFAVK